MAQSTSFPFYKDLKTALVLLVNASLHAQQLAPPNGLVYLQPTPAIDRTGCWCSNPHYPFDHDYTSCPHTATGPHPSAVDRSATPQPCWHATPQQRREALAHRLCCFDPSDTTARFMDWFMQPRAFIVGPAQIRDERQRSAILRCLHEYETHCPGARGGPVAEKFDVLCRLLVDLRRQEIPFETRSVNCSWEAERVLVVLGWRGRPFEQCLGELERAMRVAAERRLESEERRRCHERRRRA